MFDNRWRGARRADDEGGEVPADHEAERRPRSFRTALWASVREVFIVVGLAMVLSFLIKTFLVQPFHIPSGSMEDTLAIDDRVVVSKLTPGPVDLERGDVVVFADPGGWLGPLPPQDRSLLHGILVFVGLAPNDSQEYLIKRVIGLPGDRVACCTSAGEISVNGVPVDEPYVKHGDTPGGGQPGFDITVPDGHVWVMGDHRSDSADSRAHDDGTGTAGSVPIDVIQGRAVIVIWPLDRLTWLSIPERVFGES
ncbi:MAG: S26 family signal peptidase [Actinomycetales bacterium]|nr:MAG: S26 family signal peptidase [Actinomycetales bacterium]